MERNGSLLLGGGGVGLSAAACWQLCADDVSGGGTELEMTRGELDSFCNSVLNLTHVCTGGARHIIIETVCSGQAERQQKSRIVVIGFTGAKI